jgi:hypothetical protein
VAAEDVGLEFLSWQSLAWAAGLTVPPLVTLYFLKLRREEKPVPSTLLWKRAVQDLRVNAPFQRLRSNLLLLLQLLILAAGAVALGKPMFESVERPEDTLILLIDHSASMSVVEADNRTRLDIAKEQARHTIENMRDGARAMIISYADRASVVSSFDTNKAALQRKIDSIEPTQSRSLISEAIRLAEAFTQNMVISSADGAERAVSFDDDGEGRSTGGGPSVPPVMEGPPVSLFAFTDGRVADSQKVALQKFAAKSIEINRVGTREDNVGILTMQARRTYDRPEILQVAATVQNFGAEPVQFDATLYIDGEHVDVQSVSLAASAEKSEADRTPGGELTLGNQAVIAFDDIEYGAGGVVEVVLNVDDALSADDRAWTIIEPPRNVRVLLVTGGNLFLEKVLRTLPLMLDVMTPNEYEAADDEDLAEGDRSLYDLVIMDGHDTERLPLGSYLFWGAIPQIEGVGMGARIDNELIINWDDTHPILRHVHVESLTIYEWNKLQVPNDAVVLLEGQTSPVMAYVAREGRAVSDQRVPADRCG